MEQHDLSVEILRRMYIDAQALATLISDPVLEGRVPFLLAYLHDILRLKDPFGTIEHLVAFE